MERLIITRWKGRILTALFSEGKAVQLSLEESDSSFLNNVYIGKVQTVVPNINAAFVEFEEGKVGYLSLSGPFPRPINRPQAKKLSPGDEILVQVSREPVKTKAPVLTSCITLTGRLLVLTGGKPGVSFSSKLGKSPLKAQLKPLIEERLSRLSLTDCGVIVRTNAADRPVDEILKELEVLASRFLGILSQAPYRTAKTCLDHGLPGYIASLRDSYSGQLEAIITDQEDCYEQLRSYLLAHQPEQLGLLSRYSDPLVSLSKVYSLEHALREALGRRVWLKSGGYLVIEPTEALVVIDVNTGKYSGRKNKRETILKINQEAAWEIARQLRLRNLSGIILVDFIDSEEPEDAGLLMDTLSQAVARDHIKTTVVEMTKLGLVEITRKKVLKPLYEQVGEISGYREKDVDIPEKQC